MHTGHRPYDTHPSCQRTFGGGQSAMVRQLSTTGYNGAKTDRLSTVGCCGGSTSEEVCAGRKELLRVFPVIN